VVLCAWLLAAAQEPDGPPGRAWSFGLAILVVVMLALQPDFGQAALVLFSWGVMYFVAGAPVAPLAALAGGVVAVGVVAYESSEHFARRINGFLNPEVDPRTQLGYATNAIREGGFFGLGLGEGVVKNTLPDAHTDFIVAVAAEEFGFVLVAAIIGLYALVVVGSLARLARERDPFIRLAGTGLACSFGVQAMINMGVAVRLLPAKGMTLPFVSYGGSSLIAGGIAVGDASGDDAEPAAGRHGRPLGRRG
jgi:cell division protein FtsW